MEREEAKAFLIDISYDLGTVGMEYLSVKDGEKMRDAIETLEQEPILNKIRAEIEQLPTSTCTEKCRIRIDADDFKENVLEIFDKYNRKRR